MTVDLTWYCGREDLKVDAAEAFLAVVRRHLPEALPRRFGEYEPLQGKLADGGEAGFIEAWRTATSNFFAAGTWPCLGASFSAGPSARFPESWWSMDLQLAGEPLRVPAWRDALQRVFVTLAQQLPAFFASAEVTRDHLWSGRTLWSDDETVWPISPMRYRDGWLGLPPIPTWWAWFGAHYRDVVQVHDAVRATDYPTGVLVELSEEPADRDSARTFTHRWVGPALQTTLAPNPRREQPAPLNRAALIPPALTP